MRPKIRFLLKIGAGVFVVLFYCEYLIYYIVLSHCSWPTLDRNREDLTIESRPYEPVRVMVLTDTHLLGSRRGHWFDKLRREWQMYRAFQTAIQLHKPELVFVLGDLTDEGLFCTGAEFDYYVQRFYSLFKVPKGTQLYVAVGNHDIGFHYRVSPYLNQRFVSLFKSPPVQMISLRGNHFVLVNSMALEGDGCFLCKPVEQELTRIERTLQCWRGLYPGKCDNQSNQDNYSRPILMQHYPLYRSSDWECDDFDAAPYPLKKERFRERWDCLSKEATTQLLNQIKPRLSLSGHTHHGCTRSLPNQDGIEITIPSFSWRNKESPNFGMGVFTPNNYAFTKCTMPRENTVMILYFSGVSLLILWFVYVARRRKRSQFKGR